MSKHDSDMRRLGQLLQKLETLDSEHTDTTLDSAWWDDLTGNFSRAWYEEIAKTCQAIVNTCGQQAFVEDLTRFATCSDWTARDRRANQFGFRSNYKVNIMKERWAIVEPQLRTYQATLSKTSAEHTNIGHVLKEMDRFKDHYKDDKHTRSSKLNKTKDTTLSSEHKDVTLDSVLWDNLVGNYTRKWHTNIANKCKAILSTCGQQAFVGDLTRFAAFCDWTATDTKTKYTGFRTFSNTRAVLETWRAIEAQLRTYQQTLPENSANFKDIAYVVKEMEGYKKHYKYGHHTKN